VVLLAAACGNVTASLDDASPGGPPEAGGIDAPADAAQLAIDRTSVDLGSVIVGRTSAPATLTITNTGTAISGALNASVTGVGYAIASNGCAATLAPHTSCQVSVTVAPTAPGTPTGTLTVATTPGGSVAAALSATALGPSALMASPPSFDFGMTLSGSVSGTTTVTVENTGGEAAGAMAVAVGGADPSQFEITSDACMARTLSVGATCQIVARFRPSAQAAGSKSATLTVAATPGGTAVTALIGTAQPPAALSANVTSATFGQVEVGLLSATTTWTITNTGDIASSVPALSQSTAEIDISDNSCTAALPAHGMCSMTVRFRPSTGGARTGTLTLTITGSTVQLTATATGMWRVTVQRTGTAGAIVSTPPGISCAGADTSCSGLFAPGAVSLAAQLTNGSGSMFGGWSGTSATSCAALFHECVLDVNDVKNLTGTFNALTANLVFVSSVSVPSNLGTTAPYDAKCNQLATAAGINNATGNNFIAWLSDANSNATTRLGAASGWIRMDGRTFAVSKTSLLAAGILNPIRFAETGTDLGEVQTFTGTLPDGTQSGESCNNWAGTSADRVLLGNSMAGPTSWTRWLSNSPCNTTRAVVCMMRQFTTGTTFATFPGKHVWLTNHPFVVGGTSTPDEACVADRPTGVATGRALISYTTAAAASLLDPNQMYVRPDGQEVGTGAEIIAGQARGGIWQLGSGAYPGTFEHSLVWTGSTSPSQRGSIASTCHDWTDASLPDGQSGDARDARSRAWRSTTLSCSQTGLLQPLLYCVEP
jgi:hypothetical protein